VKKLSFLGLAACLLWVVLISTSCNGGGSDAGAAVATDNSAGVDPATGKPAEGVKGGKAVENSPGNIPTTMPAPKGAAVGISH